MLAKSSKFTICLLVAFSMMFSVSGCNKAADASKNDAPKTSAQVQKEATPKPTFKPERPITVIVNSGAGGGTDLMARSIEKVWTKYCPQPLQVINKGAAAGAEASVFIRDTKPDGYTLLVGYGGADLVQPHISKMEYDVLNDFAPVARISINSLVLAVPTNSPYKSVKEIIDWSKTEKKPAASSVTLANGTVDLLVRAIGKATGAEVTPVPTTGDAQSVTMIMGGQTIMGGASYAGAYSQIKAGKIRPLAMATKERDPIAPDLSTLIEQGINVFSWGSVKGVAVNKNTPPEIIQYYEEVFKKVCEDAELKKLLTDIAVPIQYMNAADTKKFYKQVYDD
ncbi:MAG: transporter substrate-binding protein, partial [Clostridia bacterium]|nr:transporter substrate-binding protein [Clostridia bacterium]